MSSFFYRNIPEYHMADFCAVRDSLHDRHRPVDMYRLRRDSRIGIGMAHLFTKRQIRRTRLHESASPQQPSQIHHQPP